MEYEDRCSEIDKEIEDLRYQTHKIEGKSLRWNITNRLYGLGKVGMCFLLYYATDQNPWSLLTLPIAIDGAADLATGKHHTLLFRLLRAHPKYKLEKLVLETNNNV